MPLLNRAPLDRVAVPRRASRRDHGRLPSQATIIDDYRSLPLSPINRLMLEFAEKITEQSDLIDRAYVESLRGHGFTDLMIHDVVQVAAYFAYVNRVAHVLGVELEK